MGVKGWGLINIFWCRMQLFRVDFVLNSQIVLPVTHLAIKFQYNLFQIQNDYSLPKSTQGKLTTVF